MPLVAAKKANELVFNIFSSSKSRAVFGVDFGKLNREEKCQYVKEFFNRTPFKQQEEILDVLTNSFIKDTTLNAARQSGKSEAMTWAQAVNAIHNLYPALDDTTKIVSLANKESQSLIVGNRLKLLLDENWKHTQFFWDRTGSTKTHQVFKREAGVNTKLTGTIDYLTANPRAFGEGFSASIMFIDEAGRLDAGVFSQVVIPYGSSANAKINLTGVSRGKGPFYTACNSQDYMHLHYPWQAVETYRKSAPANLVDRHSGQTILETGLYPLRVMPLSLKKVLFPSNPWVHILPSRFQKEERIELWKLSEGIMSEEDFRSQYMLEWLAALMAILQLVDIQAIFESSDYTPPERGQDGEEYWFGFDPAGAKNLYAQSSNKDSGALAIWRRRNGIKEKVFCGELYSSQPEEAVRWLMDYVHPQYGIFPCRWGAVDITGAVGAYISEKLIASKLPVVPIMYNRTEETTKKNYKNAMFDYFKIEVQGGRVHYPKKEITDELDPDTLKPKNPLWFKAREELEVIEKLDTGGLNAQISAPAPLHDDHANADAMSIFIMDRGELLFPELLTVKKRRAGAPIRGTSLMGTTPVSQFRQQNRSIIHPG